MVGGGSEDGCLAEGGGGGRTTLKPWFALLMIGQLIHGVGASPLYTLGNVYLDESVSQRASPVPACNP